MTRNRNFRFAVMAAATLLLFALPAAADTSAFRSGGLVETSYVDPVAPDGGAPQSRVEATWPNHTMPWWYDAANAPAGLPEAAAVGVIQAAMDQWSAQCDIQFVYRGAGSLGVAPPLGESVVGWNRRQAAAVSTRVSASGNLALSGAIELSPTLVGDAEELAQAALHAAGHALGLDHTNAAGEAMSGPPASAYGDAAAPGPDDIAACRRLYGVPAADRAAIELRAAVAGVPVCAPVPANLYPPLNTYVNIPAKCTGSPTSYAWTGGCAMTGANCYTKSTAPGPRTYTVVATNGTGASAPAPVTVYWGGVTNQPPPQCTVAISNSSPTVGTSVNFTATCTNSPTSYAWTGCTSTTGSCTTSATDAGVRGYSVAASNATGSGPAAQFSVNWQAAGTGGGGAPGAPVCTLRPSSLAPAVNTLLSIATSCSPTPTYYAWTGCSMGSKTCYSQSPTAGPKTYTLRASNSAGVGAPVSVTIQWGGEQPPPPPPAAPACTVGASDTAPTVGTSVTLTATCSNGPTTFAWTNCTSTAATCTASATAPALQTYSVVATNGGGSSAPANVSVNWKAAAPPPPAPIPVCAVAPSNSTPSVGSNVTLTANCTNSPSSYAWTNCNSSAQVCTTTSATAGAVNYSVVATNGGGNSTPVATTVNWQASVPPTCTLGTSNALPTVGNNITLTATCTGAPTSYAWTGCTSASSTCTTSAPAAGTASYAVTATNAAGDSQPASVSVTWRAAAAGTCNGWPSFSIGDLYFTGERAFTYEYDYNITNGFGNRIVAVATLHVPADARQGTFAPINIYEYMGPNTWRRAWVSKDRCDLSPAKPAYAVGPAPHIYLIVGTHQSGKVTVQPGETWYLMIVNQSDVLGTIKDSCSSGLCEIGVTAYPFQ